MTDEIDWHQRCRDIAEWLGHLDSCWAVSDDGGESMCASVGDHWHTKRELAEWLESQKDKGCNLDYELVEVETQPLYHIFGDSAWKLHSALIERDYHVHYDTWRGHEKTTTVTIRDSWSGDELAKTSEPGTNRLQTRNALVSAAWHLVQELQS